MCVCGNGSAIDVAGSVVDANQTSKQLRNGVAGGASSSPAPRSTMISGGAPMLSKTFGVQWRAGRPPPRLTGL
eukprot:6367696-Heterocapsa_arctica.AAC.1